MNKLLIAFILFISFSNTFAKELKIITSIKPIHSIISEIAYPLQNIDLIIDKNASPHNFQIKPSIARKINQADIVFLIDYDFEVFLKKYKSKLVNKEVYEISKFSNLELFPSREENLWNGEDHHHCDHEHTHFDLHFWLDIDNVIDIIDDIKNILIKHDPENQNIYTENSNNFINKLKNTDIKINKQLNQSKGNFLVFHDAYQYFENRYGLESRGAISLNPNVTPGAQAILKLQKLIKDENIICIFREPQFSPKIVDFLRSNSGIKSLPLDAEWGSSKNERGQHFIDMMEELANNFRDCLS